METRYYNYGLFHSHPPKTAVFSYLTNPSDLIPSSHQGLPSFVFWVVTQPLTLPPSHLRVRASVQLDPPAAHVLHCTCSCEAKRSTHPSWPVPCDLLASRPVLTCLLDVPNHVGCFIPPAFVCISFARRPCPFCSQVLHHCPLSSKSSTSLCVAI